MRFMMVALLGVLLLICAVPMWLAFMGIVGSFLPWLLIGLAFWGVSTLCGGSRRGRQARWERREARWERRQAGWERRQQRWEHRSWTPPAASRPRQQAPSQRPATAPAAPATIARLPLDVEVKVEQIRRKVEVLLQHANRFPLGSEDLYVVRAVIGDYLPRTLDAYLALPSGNAMGPNGKTALQELKEQLDLLDSKLNEITDDLQRDNLDRLLANRRFLEQRFA